jgi:hypothetical protein
MVQEAGPEAAKQYRKIVLYSAGWAGRDLRLKPMRNTFKNHFPQLKMITWAIRIHDHREKDPKLSRNLLDDSKNGRWY